jgi:hypothetical protein
MTTLTGFEDWLPYKENLQRQVVSTYFPYQGDIIQLKSSVSEGTYDLFISGCCDIYQETVRNCDNLDYLTFLKVIPISTFILNNYKSEHPLGQLVKTEFEEYLKNTAKQDINNLFISSNIRYFFIPHQIGFLEKDIIIDCQSIKCIKIDLSIDRRKKDINNYLGINDSAINLFTRLNYLYRDAVLQKFSFYQSRIALPDTHIKTRVEKENFNAHINSRIIDELFTSNQPASMVEQVLP